MAIDDVVSWNAWIEVLERASLAPVGSWEALLQALEASAMTRARARSSGAVIRASKKATLEIMGRV